MEELRRIAFSLTVETDQRTITKTGDSWDQLGDAIDDLYDQDLCPFDTGVEDDEGDDDDLEDEDVDADEECEKSRQHRDTDFTPSNHEE